MALLAIGIWEVATMQLQTAQPQPRVTLGVEDAAKGARVVDTQEPQG